MITSRLTLVAVAALSAFGCKSKSSKSERKAPPVVQLTGSRALPDRAVSKVTRLRVTSGGQTVELERDSDGWMLTAPVKGRADTTSVEMALREVERLEFASDPVATASTAWSDYGVAPRDVVQLEISLGETTPLTLHLGKKGYVRVGDDPRVYRAYHINYFTFAREVRLWRARRLLALRLADVTDMTITRGKESARARRASDGPRATWTLVSGAATVGTFDPLAPGSAATRITSMIAYDVVDRTAAAAGLDAPRVTVVLRAGQATHTIRVGSTDGAFTYVSVDGKHTVFTVKNHAVAWLLAGPKAWAQQQ